jgi:broad specificity phosphatase PhoE
VAVYIVRHGQTAHNNPSAEAIRGWLDLPLVNSGMQSAHRAAQFLRDKSLTHLYTSDLRRAHDTAKIMTPILGLAPDPQFDLRPWHVGDFAGQPVQDVADQLGQYMGPKADQAPPGGESFKTFYQRWQAFLLYLLAKTKQTGENIAAVTHARNLYALQPMLMGADMPVMGPPLPGAVVLVDGTPAKSAILHHG